MENGKLTAQEMVVNLRRKAEEFKGLATAIESNMNLAAITVPTEVSQNASGNFLQDLKVYMGDKAFRSIQLSKHFGRSKQEIESILTPVNGFELGKRGWYFVKSKHRVLVPESSVSSIPAVPAAPALQTANA